MFKQCNLPEVAYINKDASKKKTSSLSPSDISDDKSVSKSESSRVNVSANEREENSERDEDAVMKDETDKASEKQEPPIATGEGGIKI